ncbi:hypothetical protein H9L12_12785 [Sphingomonas rhizophila]|uniref:Uncharacterized protein n=1 Tax=Sphingomonas rhizophila TaxID=2071607 RepID=A0A7G9SB22_9SPHN|nr:hypothetical protein [Sphingomonas rhizophila]QNN65047.1 hypothetical protein H9L12_12785 [Sphingomonas rhizophila]
MRRLLITLPLFVAACTAPRPVVETPKPAEQVPAQRGDLIGLSTEEIGVRFGRPDLTVAEGPGTKVQYRSRSCVLDLYLYVAPSGQGAPRVTHVDARTPAGDVTDIAGCEAAIDAR